MDEPTYAEASAELESILTELDTDDLDVDVLAERVRRAAELIRLCRQRIGAARMEVEQIVAELDQADGQLSLTPPDVVPGSEAAPAPPPPSPPLAAPDDITQAAPRPE